MGFLRSALTSSLLLAGNAAAIDPVVMKGSKFFYENGTQFFMKGVAYQQEAGTGPGGKVEKDSTYSDPLADATACKRDVPLLAALGTNTIRTYAINPESDHTECMDLLEKAGIYVIADLGEPSLSINRDSPAWNVKLFDRYKAVIDELGKFDNVIGFFSVRIPPRDPWFHGLIASRFRACSAWTNDELEHMTLKGNIAY